MSSKEVEFNTESLFLVLFTLSFWFVRSWLIYFLAYHLTGYETILVIAGLFIILDGYHAIFNYRIEKLRKSNIPLIRSISDTIFISVFIVYYLINFI
ncbi:hypothetical protein [Paenalkalicoccus suaedae]|nr:hypothetical protein [Paenalkalicoccus suaedae]